MIDAQQRGMNRLSGFVTALGTLGLAAMAAVLCWQVFARYVLNASPAWSEQLALVLTQWFVLLGGAVGIWEAFHIRITEFVDRAPLAVQFRVALTVELLNGIFALMLCWQGIALALRTWHHQVPTLVVSQGMVYLAIPVAGALILLFSGLRLLALLRS